MMEKPNQRDLGVTLSGGGHRASLFTLGSLLYMVDLGTNERVATVCSVSGCNGKLSLKTGHFCQRFLAAWSNFVFLTGNSQGPVFRADGAQSPHVPPQREREREQHQPNGHQIQPRRHANLGQEKRNEREK